MIESEQLLSLNEVTDGETQRYELKPSIRADVVNRASL